MVRWSEQMAFVSVCAIIRRQGNGAYHGCRNPLFPPSSFGSAKEAEGVSRS
jgi:hypothetical protein